MQMTPCFPHFKNTELKGDCSFFAIQRLVTPLDCISFFVGETVLLLRNIHLYYHFIKRVNSNRSAYSIL